MCVCVCVVCVRESVSISLIIIERRLGLWWCVVWLVERLWATASKYYQQVNSQISPAQYTSREKRSRINFSSLVVYRESMHPAECTLRLSFLVSLFFFFIFLLGCLLFSLQCCVRTSSFHGIFQNVRRHVHSKNWAPSLCWSDLHVVLYQVTAGQHHYSLPYSTERWARCRCASTFVTTTSGVVGLFE